jgi:catechol 2,3-dioxygenase-like lactoylglutathione lyase family enzyme
MTIHVAHRTDPAVHTISLACGTFLTTDLRRARRLLEEGLDLECVRFEPHALLARERGHGRGEPREGEPYFMLEVREAPTIAYPQKILNHWGVSVSSQGDVDRAYAALGAEKERLGVVQIQKPRVFHAAYSFYFEDADSNWWEVEHRIPKSQYESLRKIGDVV